MGSKKLLLTAVLLCGSAFAQNNLVPVPPVFLGPATAPRLGANLTITFCTSVATGAPCTLLAQAYADSTNSFPINQSTTPLKTDALGNAPVFYAAPGQYSFTVTGPGIGTPQGPYQITVSCIPGSTCVATNANNTFTGNNTHTGTETFSGPTSIPGGTSAAFSAALTTQSLNGDLWVGLGAGQYASMTACYAALAAGQTCNVPQNWSDPTWTANLALSKNNSGFLFHGAAFIPMSTFSVTQASGLSGTFFRSISGSANPGVGFSYTGSGTAFNIGDSAADTKAFVMEGITIDTSGGGTNAKALTLARNQQFYINGLKLFGSGTGNNQTGLNLDGTGNFTGSGVFNNIFFGSYGTCINMTGVITGFFAANVNKIHGGFLTNCTTAVNIGVGVSNVIDDIAIQSSTTAVNFASNASVGLNRISFYTAGNTTDVAFGAGASIGNYADVLGTANPNVTGTRGNNTVNWTPNFNWDSLGNVSAAGNFTANGATAQFRGYLADSAGVSRVSWVGGAGANTFISAGAGGGVVVQPNVTFNGVISSYNGSGTVAGGVPSIVAEANATAQAANITTTTLYTVPASGVGTYRVSAYAVVTQQATTSATLPNVQIGWTDADSSVSETPFITQATSVANPAVGANNTGVPISGISTNGTVVFQAKASTNITYATASYASTGATPMQYAVHIKLEYLGN